jgi:hypothetical protein
MTRQIRLKFVGLGLMVGLAIGALMVAGARGGWVQAALGLARAHRMLLGL